MSPIDQIVFVKSHLAPPGSLLLRRIGQAIAPRLIVEIADEDGDADQIYIPLTASGNVPAFSSQPTVTNGGLWLAAGRWELRVDPETSYSATGAMPITGDAFISAGIAGILANWQGHSICFSLAGAALPEPNWAESFVGFRKWEIVYWPDANNADAPVQIANFERPA